MSKSPASQLLCHQFPYHEDNYGFLLHDPKTGDTAAIDAGCEASYHAALAETGYKLSHILITHHHWDHSEGLSGLKQATGARVYGPAQTKEGLSALIDVPVRQDDVISFGDSHLDVIQTPGHTLDMVNYYSQEAGYLFSGDTLFTLGCGRLFEGDGQMMWHSLEKLLALPDETILYSAHEYALANAAFAKVIEPDNPALLARISAIEEKRAKGEPSVPSTIAQERATNPFCRANVSALKDKLGLSGHDDAAVFTEIRRRKDIF